MREHTLIGFQGISMEDWWAFTHTLAKKWVWRFQQQLERAAACAQPALEPKSKISVQQSLKIFGSETLSDLCQMNE